MSTDVISSSLLPVLPRVNIRVRPAVLDDLPFIDALQKKHTKQVGFMPKAQFEGKIRLGHVLVAEQCRVGFTPPLSNGGVNPTLQERVGYLIGNDQYFKRDDVGIIYQINVLPEYRRSLVAASLLKAQFDRSAYGCRLYCCWCAQDIEANRFWESMGFVALAFRAGSEKKSRTHIFWQKRIVDGDVTTPWWFPSQTSGGSIREDRLVLPIPPGKQWWDEMPRVLPSEDLSVVSGQLPGGSVKLPVVEKTTARTSRKKSKPVLLEQPVVRRPAMLWFRSSTPVQATETVKTLGEKPLKPARVKRKNDPVLIKAARELRDRWLEEVNSGQLMLQSNPKYNACRAMQDSALLAMQPMKCEALLLPVAA